LSYAPTYL